jgi:AraC-like DNA-binding protein
VIRCRTTSRLKRLKPLDRHPEQRATAGTDAFPGYQSVVAAAHGQGFYRDRLFRRGIDGVAAPDTGSVSPALSRHPPEGDRRHVSDFSVYHTEFLLTPAAQFLHDMAEQAALDSNATLRRRLEREGSAYQAIKNEVRLGVAFKQLRSSARSIGEIAKLVGFQEISAFHRAFKKWTGESSGRYRKKG